LLDGTIACGVPLPQSTPIDLAGSALREIFKEDNLLGYLIGGQALCDKSDQFLRGDSLTRLTTHKSNDTLARDRVNRAHDAGFPYDTMLVEDFLDLLR
jgi:hypothetical protein